MTKSGHVAFTNVPRTKSGRRDGFLCVRVVNPEEVPLSWQSKLITKGRHSSTTSLCHPELTCVASLGGFTAILGLYKYCLLRFPEKKWVVALSTEVADAKTEYA